MASVFIISFFGLLVTTFFIQSDGALRMEVNPQPFSMRIQSTLNISCLVDDLMVKRIVELRIQRQNQKKPIAVVSHSGVSTDSSDTSNIKADGHVDAKPGRRKLHVTISKPGMGDAGVYVCTMIYLDSFKMKKITTDFNVSIDKEDISSVVYHFKEIVQSRDSEIEALQVKTREQEQQLERTKGLVTYQCAFSMRYYNNHTLIRGNNLVFSDTVVNIGSAYNVASGAFTAPRDGLYVFHLTVTTRSSGGDVKIYLEKNDLLEAVVHPRDIHYFDQSSSSIVLSLLKGDTVIPRIEYVRGSTILWLYYSVFSGYLLSLY